MAEKRSSKRKINNDDIEEKAVGDKTTRSRGHQWWFKTNITDGFLHPQADIQELEPAKNILDVREYLRKFLLPPSQDMNIDKDN
jgi:hypothetical protein